MRCLRPLWGLLATACVGSPPPPPEPAVGTSDDAATTDATPTDDTTTGSSATSEPSTSSIGSTGAGPCDPPCAADQACIDGACLDTPCDPPCAADQACIDGVCFDMGATDTTTGEPPPECSVAVNLDDFEPPECGPCLAASCCEELQACVGDETTMVETECRLLNNCIAMNCVMVGTQRELEACANDACAAYVASWETWLAFQSCAGSSCSNECS
jgi:hypothetical protein